MSDSQSPHETPDVPPGTLVKPSHGVGMIRRGNAKGHTAGPGRPPSAIRNSARMAWDERLPFLTGVVDGVMQEIKVQAPGAKEPLVIRRSADTDDKIKAMKEIRAVGLGTLRGVSDEEVRDRLSATIREIHSYLTAEQAAELVSRIEPHWK